jgi:cytidylate kinase
MQPTTSGETYGSAQLVERQMLFRQVRDMAVHKSPTEKPFRCFNFITISRRNGSLGDAIAQEVAGNLGWRVCDREIVDNIAQNSHVRQSLVQELDEKSQNIIHDTVQRFLRMAEGGSFGVEEYHEALLKTLAYLAARGESIIVGRGSNFALHDNRAGLHVRVTASPEVCAQRLSKRWSVSVDDARRRLQDLDTERRNFIRHHFKQDIDDPRSYDLVFNTDRTTIRQVVSAILAVVGMPVFPEEVDAGR